MIEVLKKKEKHILEAGNKAIFTIECPIELHEYLKSWADSRVLAYKNKTKTIESIYKELDTVFDKEISKQIKLDFVEYKDE